MKVLIADDEKLICEWLEYCFSDIDGFELLPFAKNGEEAYQLFLKHQPEIVLTDIKMPIMDGLDLLHKIKENNPSTYVILLTAFSEFDYARKAVREGADEYFLKTEINKEMLQVYFNKIKPEIISRSSELSSNSKIPKHPMVKHILTKKEKLNEQDKRVLRQQGFDFAMKDYFSISFWNVDLFTSKTSIFKFIDSFFDVLYDLETNRYVYTIVVEFKESLSEMKKQELLHDFIKQIFENYHLRMGISRLYRETTKINLSIYESLYHLAPSFYRGAASESMFLDSFDLKMEKNREHHLNLKYSMQVQKIKNSHSQEKEDRIVKLFSDMENSQYLNVFKIKEFSIDLCNHFYAEYANHQCNFSKDELTMVKNKIEQAVYFDEIQNEVMTYYETFYSKRDINRDNLSVPIQEAISYIEQNYHLGISLDSVAEEVNLNPEYLSRCFKRETGKTYSQFLSDLRLNQARKLLVETTDQVQNIANAVGYYNVSYFSTLFKKQYGLNPFEYRKHHR